MGRRRRDGNHSPQKYNSIQYTVGNEENAYPVPVPNKTMMNVTEYLNNAQKNTLKEEILKEITEKFMEVLIGMKCTRCAQEISRYQKYST
jgi:hypothetical protein